MWQQKLRQQQTIQYQKDTAANNTITKVITSANKTTAKDTTTITIIADDTTAVIVIADEIPTHNTIIQRNNST